jgi:hypothetical protein
MTENNKLIRLNDVRISFPSLVKPNDRYNSENPKYEVTFMLDKTIHTKEIKTIQEHIDAILDDKKIKRPVPASFMICLKDGDVSDRDEMKGHYFIRAKTGNPVPLVEKNKTPITDEKRFYGGCYVNAYIQVGHYDGKGKGITAYLLSVQFNREGERFGNSVHNVLTAYDFDDTVPDLEEDLF